MLHNHQYTRSWLKDVMRLKKKILHRIFFLFSVFVPEMRFSFIFPIIGMLIPKSCYSSNKQTKNLIALFNRLSKQFESYLRIVSIDDPETFKVLCIVFSRERIQILWPLIVFSTKKILKIRKKYVKTYVFLDKLTNKF